jgi:hypothetical protein
VLRYDRLEQSSRIIITWSKTHPELSGVDLDEAAKRLNMSNADAVEAIKPAGAIYFMLDEKDVQRILKFDDTCCRHGRPPGYSRIARARFAAERSQQRLSQACTCGHFARSRKSAR